MPRAQLDALLRGFLREDLGEAGDITSRATVSPSRRAVAEVRARSAGTMAGAASMSAARFRNNRRLG